MKPRFASLCICCLALITATTAAVQRCVWGAYSLPCVDFESLQGKTMVLPANVAAIGREGVSPCGSSVPAQAGGADVIFVMDNSGSMKNGDVVDGIRTPPGDPFGIRDRVIRRAMKSLRFLADTASAGFISFNGINAGQSHNEILWASETFKQQHPLDISRMADSAGRANLDTLLAKVWKYNPLEATLPKIAAVQKTALTFWTEPLSLAKAWLSPDSGFIKTRNHAIVLISDGAISDWNYIQAMAPGLPPVFGIHLGDSSQAQDLKSLTALTGGDFFLVDPTDTAAFEDAMQNIVSRVAKLPWPTMSIANRSQAGQWDWTGPLYLEYWDDGLSTVIPSDLPLFPGKNDLSVEISGKSFKKSWRFQLDLSGPEQTGSSELVSCRDVAAIPIPMSGPPPGQRRSPSDDALGRPADPHSKGVIRFSPPAR